MTTLTATWEIEVDLAHRDFNQDHDAGRFCERLERLGFGDHEIAEYLATARQGLASQGEARARQEQGKGSYGRHRRCGDPMFTTAATRSN